MLRDIVQKKRNNMKIRTIFIKIYHGTIYYVNVVCIF